jgi:hypothetical protein
MPLPPLPLSVAIAFLVTTGSIILGYGVYNRSGSRLKRGEPGSRDPEAERGCLDQIFLDSSCF